MTPEERKAIDDAIADRREKEEEIQRLQQEVRNIKASLTSTESDIGDWKVVKMYEYSLVGKELPYDPQEVDAARQAARDEINRLIEEIKKKTDELPPYPEIPDDYWDNDNREDTNDAGTDDEIIE